MLESTNSGSPGSRTIERYRTMEEIVTNHLRLAILAGRLGPGERIQHDDVARELGVSSMPVRAALRSLHAEGLVELRPHRAAVVVSLRPDDITEIFEIRAALESRAAELAAPRLTDDDLLRLRQTWAEMDALLKTWAETDAPPKTSDRDSWLLLNRAFHSRIYAALGWPRLCALIEPQLNALHPYQRVASGFISRKGKAHLEHHEILLAAERRDATALGQRTAEHLRTTAQDMIVYFSTRRSDAEAVEAR